MSHILFKGKSCKYRKVCKEKSKTPKPFDLLKSDSKHPFYSQPKRERITSFGHMIKKSWK